MYSVCFQLIHLVLHERNQWGNDDGDRLMYLCQIDTGYLIENRLAGAGWGSQEDIRVILIAIQCQFALLYYGADNLPLADLFVSMLVAGSL